MKKKKSIVRRWPSLFLIITSVSLLSCGSNGDSSGQSAAVVKGTDSSFGRDGVATTSIGSSDDEAFAIGIQPDGKIVAAGYSNNGSQNVIALTRYTANGQLDSTFGNGGKVTTAIGGDDDEALALVIQPDGKLVISGQSWNGTQYIWVLARYQPDGSLDPAFGNGGIVTTTMGTVEDITFALQMQSNGKLVAAGITNDGNQFKMAVARYNTDGSLDATFGSGGIVITAIGTIDDEACALAIQPDGKIVTAGYTNNGSQPVLALVRYNTDGSLDPSFGNGGIVTAMLGNWDDGEALVIQPNGKLIAAGTTNNGSQFVLALARFNPNGTLDTTFNGTGSVITPIGINNYGKAVSLQGGKPIAAGYADNGSQNVFTLVRYNSDGTLDTTFNSTGVATTAIGTDDEAFAMAIDPDEKPIVAGFSKEGNSKRFALVRYEP